MSDENTRELVRLVLTYPVKLGRLNFPIVVKESTGFDVIPIDMNNEYDKRLISNMSKKLLSSLNIIQKTGVRFEGSRINEIGRQLEPYFVRDLHTPPFTVTQLASTGYPDTEILFDGQPIYMELKTSGVVAEKSSYRYFYYTKGSKIKKSARHLLVTILVEPTGNRVWNVKRFVISDLSKLKVRLKPEFNASRTDLMEQSARIIEVP
ncbi:MAG TPA: hypothetical protein VF884_08705 [Nitrososphaeraceae archaeon]